MMDRHNDYIEPMYVPFDYVVNSFSRENNFFCFFAMVVTSVSLTWSDCNAVILSVPQKTEASSIGNWTSTAMPVPAKSCSMMRLQDIG